MRQHSLLKNFLMIMAAVIVVLPTYHLLFITPAFSRFLIHQMEGNIKVLSSQLTDHLPPGTLQPLTPDMMTPEFTEHIGAFRKYFNLDKIKLLNADGLTVYSSETDEIGKQHPAMNFFPRLMGGATVTSTVKAGRPTLDGEIAANDIVESYMPFFSEQEQYLGAFEIYYQPRRQDLTFTWITTQVSEMFGLLALFLAAIIAYLTLRERTSRISREIAEEKLRRAHDQWEQTFNAMSDVVTILDDEFRFVQVNLATAKLFSTTAVSLIGRHCYEVFSSKGAPCPDCPALTELKIGTSYNSNMYNPQLDKHLLVSVSRISAPDGRPSGFVHVVRDITEQTKQEDLLRQTQKLEAIGVLTGGMVHNFRNILASIKTSAQVIEMDYAADAKLKEITSWILDSVEQGSQLVTALTQFSRMKTSRGLQPLELNKIAADAFQILRGSMSRKIELHLASCPEKLPIMGNAGSLIQVILNICNNARDAIDDIGIIRILLRRSAENAILEISDNGQGIDPGIIDKIFEPFFTTKDPDKGTGLGLSTSFGIISEHSGQIQANSEIGRGTTFTITLPLIPGEESRPAQKDRPATSAAGRRILVVDDEPMLVDLNQRLLGGFGYEVAGAEDCEEALQQLNDWQPDLVIMDLNMPVRDGFACADAMYEINPQVRIILITGSEIESEGNLDGPRSRYIKAFLTKPVSLADLTAVIGRVLATPTQQEKLNQPADAELPPPDRKSTQL